MASNSNSSSKFTKFDRNRFRKIYPVNRAQPSVSFRSQTAVNIESITVAFKGGTTASGSLNSIYKAIPVIMVAPSADADDALEKSQANVNLFITSLISLMF